MFSIIIKSNPKEKSSSGELHSVLISFIIILVSDAVDINGEVKEALVDKAQVYYDKYINEAYWVKRR